MAILVLFKKISGKFTLNFFTLILTFLPNIMRFGKRSVGILLAIITNNTAKIQLKILGRTFRLTSGAIVNAKKLTSCWVLRHDAKKRETETEPGEVLVGHVLNRWSGKDVESKLRYGVSC